MDISQTAWGAQNVILGKGKDVQKDSEGSGG